MILDTVDGRPVVAARRIVHHGFDAVTREVLAVDCPFCGGVHRHSTRGLTSLGSGDGHRIADCFHGDYFIREVPAAADRLVAPGASDGA